MDALPETLRVALWILSLLGSACLGGFLASAWLSAKYVPRKEFETFTTTLAKRVEDDLDYMRERLDRITERLMK